MRNSYIFKWGEDTYIISANWQNPSDKILVNGRYHGCVGEFKHNPKNAARSIMEMCCEFDGRDVNDVETQKLIEKALINMK